MNNLIDRCPLMQKNNRIISFGTQTNGNVFMNWESFLLPQEDLLSPFYSTELTISLFVIIIFTCSQ